MSKASEKLQQQLADLAEAINAFNSEAVQLKVTDRVFDYFIQKNAEETPIPVQSSKRPGPTRILDHLLTTDYFQTPRSLPEITNHINQQTSNAFYTYQISGVLLGLKRRQKLKNYHELLMMIPITIYIIYNSQYFALLLYW